MSENETLPRNVTTTDGAPFDPTIGPNGQQKNYVVLTEEERAKGFVRPLRRTYRHVGPPGPKHPLRDLTAEEDRSYGDTYVKFEPYPEGSGSRGRFWTQKQLDGIGRGCGSTTTMSIDIAATYARSPNFYGATFCVGCGTHLPVGDRGEFVWEGTNERVGT